MLYSNVTKHILSTALLIFTLINVKIDHVYYAVFVLLANVN